MPSQQPSAVVRESKKIVVLQDGLHIAWCRVRQTCWPWSATTASALRAQLHLRRKPLPGARAPPAAQSQLPDHGGHRHRALQRPLPLPARGQPPLRRPRVGCSRRDSEHAHRMILQASPLKCAQRSVPSHACARGRAPPTGAEWPNGVPSPNRFRVASKPSRLQTRPRAVTWAGNGTKTFPLRGVLELKAQQKNLSLRW